MIETKEVGVLSCFYSPGLCDLIFVFQRLLREDVRSW